MIGKIISLLFIFFYHSVSFSQFATPDGELSLSADNMKRNLKEGTIALTKNVSATFKDETLTCDEAIIYLKEKKVVARGNVKLIGTEIYMEGDEIFLNYAEETGSIKNGFVLVGQIAFQGKVVNRTSKTTFEAEDGYYTACSTCPPAWSFSGSKINAEIGGYAHIKSSTLKIAGIPVFWLPYLVVPLKSKRQTGFLFPKFEVDGTSGFSITEEFFWAISDNQDATIALTNYEKRGAKGLLNYRYLLSEESGGEFDTSYMKDRYAASNEERIRLRRPEVDEPLGRYHFRYGHHYELPNGYFNDIDINLVSDTLFPKDFPNEMPGHGDPALENRVSFAKNTESTHSSVDASLYHSLLESSPIHDNSNSVHRYPEIRSVLVPSRLGDTPIFADLSFNYINFARRENSFDDNDTSDGTEFNEDVDDYRTGQRIIVTPRLSTPFNLGNRIELIPSVSYQEMRYQFKDGVDPTTERRFLRTQLDARTRLSAIYGGKELKDTRYRHEIQPIISYSNIPWRSTEEHPFFKETDEELFFKQNQPLVDGDKLQFDYKDRLTDSNIVTFALNNNIVRRRWNGTSGEYQRIINFHISQSYDFYEAYRETDSPKQPWSELVSLLNIRLDNFNTHTVLKYFPYQNEATVSSRLRASGDFGDYVELEYLQDFNLQDNDGIQTVQRVQDMTFRAGVISNFFSLDGGITYSILTEKVRSYKYRLRLKPPGNCWAFDFSHRQEVGASSSFGFEILFLFDGKSETSFGG